MAIVEAKMKNFPFGIEEHENFIIVDLACQNTPQILLEVRQQILMCDI